MNPNVEEERIDLSPIRTSIHVAVQRDKAFALFTSDIGSWWPARTHSIGEERVTSVVFETELGGRIYERWDDGTEHEWGRVLNWEPPERVTFTWHPSLDPGTPTEVEVRFLDEGTSTRVELVHLGWERVETHRSEVRDSYVPGWDFVLGAYGGAVI